LLKNSTNQTAEIPLKEFAEYNEHIFMDATIPPDKFSPLENPTAHHITQAELTEVIQHHFKANKSSGLSRLPLQLLKHLGKEGIKCVT
jgi:hypothetical protein